MKAKTSKEEIDESDSGIVDIDASSDTDSDAKVIQYLCHGSFDSSRFTASGIQGCTCRHLRTMGLWGIKFTR